MTEFLIQRDEKIARGCYPMEAPPAASDEPHRRIIVERPAGLRYDERRLTVALERRRVDSLTHRQVRGDLPQALAQLAGRADRIAALVVIERHCEVDQRLEEEASWPTLGRPDLLENLMADEELAAVEQVDSVLKARVQETSYRGPKASNRTPRA